MKIATKHAEQYARLRDIFGEANWLEDLAAVAGESDPVRCLARLAGPAVRDKRNELIKAKNDRRLAVERQEASARERREKLENDLSRKLRGNYERARDGLAGLIKAQAFGQAVKAYRALVIAAERAGIGEDAAIQNVRAVLREAGRRDCLDRVIERAKHPRETPPPRLSLRVTLTDSPEDTEANEPLEEAGEPPDGADRLLAKAVTQPPTPAAVEAAIAAVKRAVAALPPGRWKARVDVIDLNRPRPVFHTKVSAPCRDSLTSLANVWDGLE